MARLKQLLFLPGNARHADLGLLALRWATGAFLVYQSHDNTFSAARMRADLNTRVVVLDGGARLKITPGTVR